METTHSGEPLPEPPFGEESQLADQEQFRLLVQGVTDYAIYLLSPAGKISSWNLGAQRIKGFAAEEVIGTHFSRFYTPEDRAAGEPMRALATAEREGRFEKEGVRVRKDGTSFWANIVIDAVRGDDGQLIGFAKVTRDITPQIEARRALELARESLFHAQKMDAIGQLTGGVAHDFNNLLTAIMGSLELLRKRLPDDPKAHSLLDNALLGAQRGAALTQRMLAFARRQDLEVEAVAIPALVRGMSDLLDRSLGPGITMELRFPLKLAPALTDANQLELALLNLVVNARDAMPEGGSIIVSAKEVEVGAQPMHGISAGRYVCLSVQDNGEGMDEQTLAKATEPFFTTKDIGKGTGLGLAMVHGVAEQSGGRLVLISRKGAGTTAEIWLPVAIQPLPAKNIDAQQVEDASRTLVVLAVDDDRLVLGSTVAMLEDLGHDVMQATSASEALALLRERRIDMMVTDHAMPDTTGAQLIEMARAQTPKLPIVLATGFAELPAGIADGLVKLSKPFTQQELASAMSNAIEGKSGVRRQ